MCKKICFLLGAVLGMVAGMYLVAKNNETKKMVLDNEKKVVNAISEAKKQVASKKTKPKSKPQPKQQN